MLPTVTHEIPNRRLTAVRSVTCARYAVNSSNSDVNALVPLAHGTRSTFTPQRGHDTRHGAYRRHADSRPHDRCRHLRSGCRSYRGARFPHAPHRERRHDGATDAVNGPAAGISTARTYICVTPNSRRSTVVRRMGLSSSRVLVVAHPAHETRKPLRFATRFGDARRRTRRRRPPDTGRPAEVHGPRRSRRRQPVPVLEPPAGAPSASSWTAGTPPSRPGRKAHNCCLSGGTDGVSPEGPERSGGRAQRVDTPAGPPLPLTALPRHRATRICLKQVRHDPSVPRSPALSAPRADPTIAPQLAHTRCRRARFFRSRKRSLMPRGRRSFGRGMALGVTSGS